jgi:hypothetical protein
LWFVSGVLGVWFVEGIPFVQSLEGFKNMAEAHAQQLQFAKAKEAVFFRDVAEGRDYPMEEKISQAQREVDFVKEFKTKGTKTAKRKQNAQRTTFVLGLIALMVARGYGPFLGVIWELRR